MKPRNIFFQNAIYIKETPDLFVYLIHLRRFIFIYTRIKDLDSGFVYLKATITEKGSCKEEKPSSTTMHTTYHSYLPFTSYHCILFTIANGKTYRFCDAKNILCNQNIRIQYESCRTSSIHVRLDMFNFLLLTDSKLI